MPTAHPARTVTPRQLLAHARQHAASLRVFGSTEDWSAVRWAEIVDDPEWIYHEAAMDACTAVSARLFSAALGPDEPAAGVIAYVHDVICDGLRVGEAELAGRARLGRDSVQRMLAVIRRGAVPAIAGD